MLDLTKLNTELYEIKWVDGEVLKLKLPTQKVFSRLLQLDTLEDEESFLYVISELLTEVFNNNTNARKFTKDDFITFDISTIQLILNDYMDFVNRALTPSNNTEPTE